jgi:glycosyltransferase involved in cell wall biosynthesis
MKVLQVVDAYDPQGIGGVETYLESIQKPLRRAGYEMEVVSQRTFDRAGTVKVGDLLVHQLEGNQLKLRARRFDSLPESVKSKYVRQFFAKNDIEENVGKLREELASLLDYVKADVIHIHNSYVIFPQVFQLLRDCISGIPLIFTVHSAPFNLTLPSGKIIHLYHYLRNYRNQFDRIVAVSEYVKRCLERSDVSSTVMLIGVDTKIFHPVRRNLPLKERAGFDEKSVVIAFTGRLVKEKGLELLPKIFEVLLSENDKVRGMIIGDGHFRHDLERSIEEKGLRNSVKFVGPVKNAELPSYYSFTDVFLFPTQREALGIAAMEAMACGVPVVASDLPAIREIITNGVDGILADSGDALDFVEKCRHVISSSEYRSRISGNAWRSIAAKFDLVTHVTQLAGMYDVERERVKNVST